jgi:putative PIN family toxin of toxin-antitoxin system
MKIVLDTNVFISGIFWDGSPRKILSLWAKNKIDLLITKKILNEYLRVLHKIDKDGNIAKKWGAFIIEHSIIINDKELIQLCRDPDDNKFLNCAITGKADYIVSGDKDLLSLKKIGSIRIVNTSKFLKIHNKNAT